MANISVRSNAQRSNTAHTYQPGQSLCLIVGFACLFGFITNVVVLALPPALFNVQWRIGLLQQVGDRSIVLLFSAALMMYGVLANRSLRKQLALVCLAVGVMFVLSGTVMVRDSLKLKDMTLMNISSQEDQVRGQIRSVRDNSENLDPELTPEVLEQATQELNRRVESARQTTQTSLMKVGVASVGNLIMTGLSLIAIGRFGIRIVG